ncbi:hypothetical protein FRB99_008723 [Tulasnella sp. 403]|nr:hypothetical protein FRB99_008723 [Tulasnella sp. 403]
MGLDLHLHRNQPAANTAGAGYQAAPVNNTAGAGYGNPAVGTGPNTDPAYNQPASGRHKHEAEAAAAGGVAGHEYNRHGHQGGDHRARHVGEGAAVGGVGAHEYNKHHQNAAYDTNQPNVGPGFDGGRGTAVGAGAATGPGGMPNTTGAGVNQPAGDLTAEKKGKRLSREGKLEAAVGNVFNSTSLKQKGLAKQAEGASLVGQSQNLGQAQQLEAEATRRRGAAVGQGAHPGHVSGNVGGTGTGPQGTY